ncbi:MAG: SDR family oxidoreductase [Cellulosilyticaceae bacterium]
MHIPPFPTDTTFLVTGGAGFIGSNLVEALLDHHYFVRVLDNFSTGYAKNLEPFLAHPLFELCEGDIRDFDTCLKACNRINYVLHQAAWGSVPKSLKMPLVYADINIKGTLNVLTAARDCGVKRVVYASSSSVYGNDFSLPKVESQVGTPLSPYALTKKVNEAYGRLFHDAYGLETIGLRYFNVFGKNQDPHSDYSAVIPKFISLMLQNKTPTIHGDGHISRDFTFIENVVEANLKACLAPSLASGKAFNIGCGDSISLNTLYTTLADHLNFPSPPHYGPPRSGDIQDSCACIDLAKKLLGYVPAVDFYQGIHHTIDWYKNNL